MTLQMPVSTGVEEEVLHEKRREEEKAGPGQQVTTACWPLSLDV